MTFEARASRQRYYHPFYLPLNPNSYLTLVLYLPLRVWEPPASAFALFSPLELPILYLVIVMRLLPHPPTTLSSLILLLPSLATAITLDCSDIRVDKKSFNLQALGGPHELHTIKERPPTITDTTIKLDICQALKKPKGVDKKEDCPNGSRGKIPPRPDDVAATP